MLFTINGEKLKKARGSRSQRDLAKASEGRFTDVAICLWEQGKTQPRAKNLIALLELLGCQLEDIAEPIRLP